MKHYHRHLRGIFFSIIIILLSAGRNNLCASDFTESAGTALVIALGATAGTLTITHDDPEGRVQLLESSALTLGVSYGLKSLIDAKRPDGGDHSFPSAHTSLAFTAADFMRTRYGWSYGIPAYLAASFVGYSRIEADKHYFRDVAAGAAVGILSNALFTSRFERKGVSVTACPTGNGCALHVSYIW